MTVHLSRRSAVVTVLVGLALAVLVWVEARAVHKTTSATYDEMSYLDMAFDVRAGNFEPLVRAGVAPLPVLLDATAIAPFQRDDLGSTAILRIIDRVRVVHLVSVGLPLVLLVYVWLVRKRGWAVAGCAALVLALSPTVMAHASLATTDVAVTLWSVATLAALVWHHQNARPWRLVAIAVALGLAFAAKYSAICLIPAVIFSVGWRRALIVGTGAAVVLWAANGFLVMPLIKPEDYVGWLGNGSLAEQALALANRISLPAPIVGALRQGMMQRAGHDAFLLGHSDSSGWWYYFPVAVALKSTPVELVGAISLPFVISAAWAQRDHAFTLWTITLAMFAASLLISRVDIGVRYALPLYPLGVLCVADAVSALACRGVINRSVAGVALAGQLLSSAFVAPHYLSYFNALAGGPAGGYRYLGDSNIDWGQDLPTLAREIEDLGHPPVCLAYFGFAPVAAYGITASDWRDPAACRQAEWLALSVTYLQGSYIDNDPFEALLSEAPDRRAGFSIFLYDMRRPVVAAALQKAWAAENTQP